MKKKNFNIRFKKSWREKREREKVGDRGGGERGTERKKNRSKN